MRKAFLSLFLTLLLAAVSFSQTVAPKSTTKPKTPPCQVEESRSFSDGFKQGTEQAAKDSWANGFRTATALDEQLYSVKVGESPSLQNISIVVEDIDGSTSYQFAAAEVIRSYFSDFLAISSAAPLSLHITGINSMQIGYGSNVQSIQVEVLLPASQTLTAGSQNRLLSGTLHLAFGGGTMKGYSLQEKTQAVKEYV